MEYGVPITYEDAQSVIDTKTRTALSFNYEGLPPDAPLDVRKRLAGDALGEAIRNYNAGLGVDIFTVSETEKGFRVMQRKFFDASGQMQDAHLVLDRPITILPQVSGSVDEVIDTICKADPPAEGAYWSWQVQGHTLSIKRIVPPGTR